MTNGLSVSTISGGRTGGPFSFFTGVLALFTSAGMSLYAHNKQELANEEYRKCGYNPSVQLSNYDGDRAHLFDHYNYIKVMDEVRKEYPSMNDVNRHQVALIAIAKRLMEEETPYKYEVPEKFRFLGNIERFANENSKAEDLTKWVD